MDENPKSLAINTVREKWTVVAVEPLENGPHRGALWVRLAGKRSWIELTFSLTREREAIDLSTKANERITQPAVDCGELRFRCLLNPGDERVLGLAEELETPPVVLLVPPHKGTRGRSGSFVSIQPAGVKLLALKPAARGRGFIVRFQNVTRRTQNLRLTWLGKRFNLGRLQAGRIGCWRVTQTGGRWRTEATDVAELG